MRHMARTHGLDLAWLVERFERKEYMIEFCPTKSMSANIFTKAFPDKLKWIRARKLIGHFTSAELGLKGAQASGTLCAMTGVDVGNMDDADLSLRHVPTNCNRIIIEFACSADSKIGQKTVWSKNCHVFRVTEKTRCYKT